MIASGKFGILRAMVMGADDENALKRARAHREAMAALVVRTVTQKFSNQPADCGIYTHTQNALAKEMVDAPSRGFPVSAFMNAALSITSIHFKSRSGEHDQNCHANRAMR